MIYILNKILLDRLHEFSYFYKKNELKLIFNILTFLCLQFTLAQNDSIVKGKIIVETNDNDGVTIINLANKNSTISENGGYFKIKAKVNDTIMFSAIHLEARKIVITKKDFGPNLLFIKLKIHTKHIKEIMITNGDGINAESLGLVKKGQKQYTPAERRLKTASALDGQWGLNTAFSIDPLFNWLSGRTKQLKKELEVERKEFLQEKIINNFERDYIIQILKIPDEYVDGYIFYVVEDQTLVDALKAKNKTMVSFRLSYLATDYLKLKENEIEPKENKNEQQMEPAKNE